MTAHPRHAAVFRRLLALDRALAARGFPPLSDFWRGELDRFLRSPHSQWVARVGRRGGKSTTWCKLAVAWALYGPWSLPPGELGVVAFVSTSRDEASSRLRTIEAMLTALGVSFTRRGDEIQLESRPCVFKVISCTASAVLGFTCILAIGDEVAAWRDSDGLTNPAGTVVENWRPTLATQIQHGAFMVLSSAPFTTSDFHAQEFARGEDGQCVSFAPSWVANPSLTESMTRGLEPDERKHAMAYGAVPRDATATAFADGIEHCIAHGVAHRPYERGIHYGITLDAGLRSSRTAITAVHFSHVQPADGAPVVRALIVDRVVHLTPTVGHRLRAFVGRQRPKLSFEAIVAAVVELCREYRVREVTSDIHLFDALEPQLLQHGVRLQQAGMGIEDQARRSAALVSRVRAGSVSLLDHGELLRELRQAVERERGKRFILTSPDRRDAHDDILDTLLLACDERFNRLPASGGNIKFEPARIINNGPILHIAKDSGYYYRESPDGTRIPVEMPRTDPRFDEHRRARWAQGITTPADYAEFGEKLHEVMHETLHQD